MSARFEERVWGKEGIRNVEQPSYSNRFRGKWPVLFSRMRNQPARVICTNNRTALYLILSILAILREVTFPLTEWTVTLDYTILVQDQLIRTDWIHRIERGKENGVTTCTIWFSIGPVGVRTFTGKNAETALRLLAAHPVLKA